VHLRDRSLASVRRGVYQSAMAFYDDFVVPYCIELTCGMKDLVPERRKVAAGLHGVVLEIGFGSGLNVPHYPGAVTRVVGVDPSLRARKIGRKRIEASRAPVELIGLEAERIPLPDASVDSALSTFTLCTIPDAERALREVRRVLSPGGSLFFLEHGRAPDPKVSRWQDRLNGLQRAIAGGCNLNRDIRALVESAGFRLESVEADYFPKGPRTHSYLYSGRASAG
jgi:ubiquinone/menaquinone biosynthesis C-methylase UbiE